MKYVVLVTDEATGDVTERYGPYYDLHQAQNMEGRVLLHVDHSRFDVTLETEEDDD